MKRLQPILFALVSASLMTGCLVSGTVRTRAYVAEPRLVYVSPGVQVVADYDDSVFYSDGYYWRNDGVYWYRSNVYTGGWYRYSAPRAIVSIDRPRGYVRYHGDNGNHYGQRREEVRDHRQEQRQDRQEHRQEQRQDRQDHRQEQRQDRQDHREQQREERQDHRQQTGDQGKSKNSHDESDRGKSRDHRH